MSEDRATTLKDLQAIAEYNTGMVESMVQMMQSMQSHNFKMEKKIVGLESEVHDLWSKMAGKDGVTASTVHCHCDTDKNTDSTREDMKGQLTELSVDVKSFVKSEVEDLDESNQRRHDDSTSSVAQVGNTLMKKMDALMASQAEASLKVASMVTDITLLKKTDTEMSTKMSGLIRVTAHGNIKVYQELMSLGITTESSNANLTKELKSQTKRIANTSTHANSEINSEISALKDIANNQTVELVNLKGIGNQQLVELASDKVIAEHHLPHCDQVMLKDELTAKLQNIQTEKGQQSQLVHSVAKKPATKPTFLKRSDFGSRDKYTEYVKANICVGMKVCCCESLQGARFKTGDKFKKGDKGEVTSICDFEVVDINWTGIRQEAAFMYQIEIID